MKTPKEWWDRVKYDPNLLVRWLRDQYHSEAIASIRMRHFVARFGGDGTAKWQEKTTVEEIAKQEQQHADWIGVLLQSRGVEPSLLLKSERYWDKTLKGIDSWDTGCAVAAHAEAMRLGRIKVIVADEEGPADVREVFGRILPQAEFHERAFHAFASAGALFTTLGNHIAGAEALGLRV
jgi:hypothetical protein